LLQQFLPAAASAGNPVDTIASASGEHFRRAVETLLPSGEIDALIVLYIDVGIEKPSAIAEGIGAGVAAVRNLATADKPVLACMLAPEIGNRPIPAAAEQIPNFAFPENPARVLGKLANYAEWRSQPAGFVPDFSDIDPKIARAVCREVVARDGAGWLGAEETRAVLKAMSLPLLAGGVARSADEAASQAREIGFPVALKLASREIVHKTEIGGVKLALASESAVRDAFTEIHERLSRENKLQAMDGVLVQPMIRGGVELMVGVTHDPSFGPLLAFGLGGIHVEILKDVSFRVTPITDRDAADMVRAIRGYRLLEGYRGHPPADIAAIQELLLRVARLVEEVPEIEELDVNPVIALPPGQGCRIIDARVRVKPEKQRNA
jgi:acyl-CoA synthetase (NDP forming)